MNFLKKLLGIKNTEPSRTINLDKIKDINSFMIDLDNRICELCNWGDDLEKLTDAQLSFFYIQNLEREVNNGGFKQFFYNSSGDFSVETITALKTINALYTTTLLETAIAVFPDSLVPKDRTLRQELIESLGDEAPEKWHELDTEFYEYRDNLDDLTFEYIKQYQSDFLSL